MKQLFSLCLFLVLVQCAYSQGITSPPSDKSVVYIARPAKLGAAINFKYFIDNQFIGKANAGKYFRIECKPGEHLIWAKSENLDFVQATFEAGKVYVIEAKPKMGGMKARVKLIPLNYSDEKQVAKTVKLINKKAPFIYPEDKLKTSQSELEHFIQESLVKFNTDKKDKEIIKITSDMHYKL